MSKELVRLDMRSNQRLVSKDCARWLDEASAPTPGQDRPMTHPPSAAMSTCLIFKYMISYQSAFVNEIGR